MRYFARVLQSRLGYVRHLYGHFHNPDFHLTVIECRLGLARITPTGIFQKERIPLGCDKNA